MKSFIGVAQIFLLFGISVSYSEDDAIIVTEDFFPEDLVVYEGKHDIVQMLVPLKYDHKEKTDKHDESNVLTVFFVEGDIDQGGHIKDKGVYVLKHGKATKLLNNGRDVTSSNDRSRQVFFGAKDGLYKYNEVENRAEKYGVVNESIKGLVHEFDSDAMYILTDDHNVYKIMEGGTIKTKVDEIKKADQIVIDFSNNLYFYGKDKVPHVYDGKYIKKIEGLPKKPYFVSLVRPSFAIESGVIFIADNKTYTIYADGTSESLGIEFEVMPTAYSSEATLIQYYAYNRKIYEYNILNVYLRNIVNEFSRYVEDRNFVIDFLKRVGKSFPSYPRRV